MGEGGSISEEREKAVDRKSWLQKGSSAVGRGAGKLSLHCLSQGLLPHGAPARAWCPEQPSALKVGEQEGKAIQQQPN